MSPEAEKLLDRMLDVIDGAEAADIFDAAYGVLSLSLSHLPPAERERLLERLEDGCFRNTMRNTWEPRGLVNEESSDTPRSLN